MSEASTDLEQRVERIHQLLDGKNAKVAWNDRIPDPDNPSQLRQIDVTIRRDGKLTLVECRLHKSPQDVTWIEELIGRKASLKASAVIAVSSSGFTEGASRKARAHGIVLRDLQSLSDEEIRAWGHARQVQLRYLEFKQAALRFGLPILPAKPYLVTREDGSPMSDWRGVFEAAKQRLSTEAILDGGKSTPAHVELRTRFKVNGVLAHSAYFSAIVRRVKRKVSLTSLVAYKDPGSPNASSEATVGLLDLGKSEIVEDGNRFLVAFDVSELKVPRDCLFESMDLMFPRPIAMSGLQLLGLDNPGTYRLSLRFEYYLQSKMPTIHWGAEAPSR
jgi:hypothetical protein